MGGRAIARRGRARGVRARDRARELLGVFCRARGVGSTRAMGALGGGSEATRVAIEDETVGAALATFASAERSRLTCAVSEVERMIDRWFDDAACGGGAGRDLGKKHGATEDAREAARETLRAMMSSMSGDVDGDSSVYAYDAESNALRISESASAEAVENFLLSGLDALRAFARTPREDDDSNARSVDEGSPADGATTPQTRVDVVHRRGGVVAVAITTKSASSSAADSSANDGLSKEIVDRDLEVVNRIDDETTEKVYSITKAWLADTRERENYAREMAHTIADGDALRAIQRGELLEKALESWQDFRDAVYALELGHEEFTCGDRRLRYYLRECDRCYRRVMTKHASDAAVLELGLREEIRAYELALATQSPSAREMNDLAKKCVLAVRAVNALDASIGSMSRVVDKSYADGEADCKSILRDSMRDLRCAVSDLKLDLARDRDVRTTENHPHPQVIARSDASDDDVTALHHRVRPIVERYASGELRKVVHRVVRALDRDGQLLTYGIKIARCATFIALIDDAARAHAEHADDVVLADALRHFELEDASSRNPSSTARGKKKKRRSNMIQTQAIQTNAIASATETSLEVEPRSEDVAELADAKSSVELSAELSVESPEAVVDVSSKLDIGASDDRWAESSAPGIWVKARSSRRKSASSGVDRVSARSGNVKSSARRASCASPAAMSKIHSQTIPTPKRITVLCRADRSSAPPAPPPAPPAPAPAPAPPPHAPPPNHPRSVGRTSNPEFPPKPRSAVIARSMELPIRSRVDDNAASRAESARERESGLRVEEFPPLPAKRAIEREPNLRANVVDSFAVHARRPRASKTWAEAKRAIDGVVLPSLIKIK